MEEKEIWMKKLKEKLDDYSEPIPASGWEQLERDLTAAPEKRIYPYRKWIMSAAAVILLALVSSVSLYFLGTPAADDIRNSNIPAVAAVPDALPNVQTPDDKSKDVEQAKPFINSNRHNTGRELAKADIGKSNPVDVKNNQTDFISNDEKPLDKNSITGDDNNLTDNNGITGDNNSIKQRNEAIDNSDKQTTNNVGKEAVDNSQSAKTNDIKGSKSEVNPTKSHRPSSRDKLHIPTEKAASKKSGWSTSLSVGNTGGATAETKVGASPYMARVNMAAVSNGLMSIPNDKMVVFDNGIPYLYQANQLVDIKHHQPITFGISVRKELKKGFSVETGLTYTLLSSDATLSDGELNVKQKLHYLGIPLKANWNFIDKKLFSLYVTGGGAIEKCVYGKLGSEKETVKPLQFSVSGGVGAQINATKRLGFYVEPGVAYFFDDGSDVQTIRKENPFNFNIQAGIRLTY